MLDNAGVVLDKFLSIALLVIAVVAIIWMILMIVRMVKEINLKKKREVWMGSLVVSIFLFIIALAGVVFGLWFGGFDYWGHFPR